MLRRQMITMWGSVSCPFGISSHVPTSHTGSGQACSSLSAEINKASRLWKDLTGILICCILIFFFPTAGESSDERIANLVIQVTDSDILVSANLIRGFSQTTEEDIQNGIPKDLFYYVLLKRRQPLWFDEEMISKTLKYTLKYDLLKKQYSVTRRMNGMVQQEVMEDFMAMKRLISTINSVKIADTRVLNSKETYYISVKAEMKATKLPFYLDYFLFFIPILEVDTPWARSGPIYKQ